MEENNTGFSEFAEAFDAEGDYQTTGAEVQQTEQPSTEVQETASEAQESPESEVTETGADAHGESTETAKAEGGAEKPISEHKFSIKVDKETREVGIEELKELAQKGGAFDRVKVQLAEARQLNQKLQTETAASRAILGQLSRIAKDAKTTPEALLRQVQVNWRMSALGETEKEAKAKIEADDVKRELDEEKAKQKPAQETAQERAQREVAEFREENPGVELTAELLSELSADVKGGMSLAKAYQKREAAKKDQEMEQLRNQIAELQKQIEADKKNRRNRASSPGSQKDSGGQTGKSDFDDFLAAFN